MPGYRIVATGIKEFDYPKGNDNVYTSYTGVGGVLLDSAWKRLLFAWTKADANILLTSDLKPESRIQFYRDVHERVAQIAPFLRLDNDPYAVLTRVSFTGFRTLTRSRITFRMQIQNEQRSGRARTLPRRVESKTPTRAAPKGVRRPPLTS